MQSIADALISRDFDELSGDEGHGFRQMIDALPAAIYTTDAQGRITHFNPACVSFSGRTPELGTDHWCVTWKLYHPDGTPMAHDQCPMAIALREGRVVRGAEAIAERPDGTRIWFEPYPTPLREATGKIIGGINMLVDITERKKAEERLHQATEQAEAANRAKDMFLAVLSHELRTPLTPVVMTVAALESHPHLPADVREDLKMIRRNVELETKLIDDLLDLSRITSGKLLLQLDPLDLNELIGHVCATCRPTIHEKAISLHCELAQDVGGVMADPARLQQVFWNLLNNAAKFTPTGGRIDIVTENCADGQVCVTVRDTGIGIAPEILPRIFDAFEQGEVRITRQFGGLGLGLAISRLLVEKHCGTIRAASDGQDKGATFVVELPALSRWKASAATQESAHPARVNGAPLRLMIVEDHADTAGILSKLLRASGHSVVTATTAARALELASRQAFDVIISDLGLPDMPGHELMRQLKARYGSKGIAMSGYGMENDIRLSMAAGFDDHLIKPLNVEQLEQSIGRLARNGGGAAGAAGNGGAKPGANPGANFGAKSA